jgi:hypothetical protein
MAKHTRFINDEQWEKIEPLLPKPKTGRVGRPCADIEKFWREFYGSCEPAPDGRICRSDTLVRLRVGAD